MLGWDKRRNLPVLLSSTYVFGKSNHLLGLPARRNSGKQSLGWPRDQAPVWSSPPEGGQVLRLTVAKKPQQRTSCEETLGGFREAETGATPWKKPLRKEMRPASANSKQKTKNPRSPQGTQGWPQLRELRTRFSPGPHTETSLGRHLDYGFPEDLEKSRPDVSPWKS